VSGLPTWWNILVEEINDLRRESSMLVKALLDVRALVPSGSEAMHIIDEALAKVGEMPWKPRKGD
jgi:hypothetical protein